MLNNPLIQIVSKLRQSQNPMDMMSQLFSHNPKFQKVMEMTKGKSPQEIQELAINTAQTQGVDINKILNQFGMNMNMNMNIKK